MPKLHTNNPLTLTQVALASLCTACASPSTSVHALPDNPPMPAPSTAQPSESYSAQAAKLLNALQASWSESPKKLTVTPQTP